MMNEPRTNSIDRAHAAFKLLVEVQPMLKYVDTAGDAAAQVELQSLSDRIDELLKVAKAKNDF